MRRKTPLRYLEFERPIEELDRLIQQQEDYAKKTNFDMGKEIEGLQRKRHQLIRDIYYNLTPYQRIQLARHPDRPYCLDYIKLLMKDFEEFHGDRYFGDDPALVGGFANFEERTVMVIGHQKGRDTEENIHRNFGMPNPEGFRKARRLMEMAERFRKPICCFIDSAGAYPGIGGEERGQAEAIASNLMVMSRLRVPIICVVTGEGGSGGALAIGVGSRVLMLQTAYYAVCTPEACAAILFKDRAKASTAVASMKIMAEDLLRMGIVDEIVPEPVGGAHQNWRETADHLRESLLRNLKELEEIPPEDLVDQRYQRFRVLGEFEEIRRKAIPLAKANSTAQQEEDGRHLRGITAAAS
jgi:acetyl-CoA carboxylase carboxyl transferase subunit alpha